MLRLPLPSHDMPHLQDGFDDKRSWIFSPRNQDRFASALTGHGDIAGIAVPDDENFFHLELPIVPQQLQHVGIRLSHGPGNPFPACLLDGRHNGAAGRQCLAVFDGITAVPIAGDGGAPPVHDPYGPG